MAARKSKVRVFTALLIIVGMATPVIGLAARHPVEDPGLGRFASNLWQDNPFRPVYPLWNRGNQGPWKVF